jgi:hypothetical protein
VLYIVITMGVPLKVTGSGEQLAAESCAVDSELTLFPAYFHGRNLAESYSVAIPGLSWQNIVVGDPLCRLK